MKEYIIKLTIDATVDLSSIKDYIAIALNEKETAVKYIRGIRREIEKLKVFPKAVSPVEDEPWHSRGVRRIKYKNFYIYYRVDDKGAIVYVLNIIYARRDQIKALSEGEKELRK